MVSTLAVCPHTIAGKALATEVSESLAEASAVHSVSCSDHDRFLAVKNSPDWVLFFLPAPNTLTFQPFE